MIISFFEEFPGEDSLSKIKLITFPTKLYIAAKSLTNFLRVKKTIKNKFVKEIVYWPILTKREGYWISPFSKRNALKRLFNELQNKKIPVMLDLELPTTQNPFLYITQSAHFFRNKKLIRNFITNYKGKVYLAEYYPNGKRKEQLLEKFGLHYDINKCHVIKMMYHSLHKFDRDFIIEEMENGIKDHGTKFIAGFGTIAKGIQGDEKILSVLQLQKDLDIAKTCSVKESVIFRLGGLNQKYCRVIKEISKNPKQ